MFPMAAGGAMSSVYPYPVESPATESAARDQNNAQHSMMYAGAVFPPATTRAASLGAVSTASVASPISGQHRVLMRGLLSKHTSSGIWRKRYCVLVASPTEAGGARRAVSLCFFDFEHNFLEGAPPLETVPVTSITQVIENVHEAPTLSGKAGTSRAASRADQRTFIIIAQHTRSIRLCAASIDVKLKWCQALQRAMTAVESVAGVAGFEPVVRSPPYSPRHSVDGSWEPVTAASLAPSAVSHVLSSSPSLSPRSSMSPPELSASVISQPQSQSQPQPQPQPQQPQPRVPGGPETKRRRTFIGSAPLVVEPETSTLRGVERASSAPQPPTPTAAALSGRVEDAALERLWAKLQERFAKPGSLVRSPRPSPASPRRHTVSVVQPQAAAPAPPPPASPNGARSTFPGTFTAPSSYVAVHSWQSNQAAPQFLPTSQSAVTSATRPHRMSLSSPPPRAPPSKRETAPAASSTPFPSRSMQQAHETLSPRQQRRYASAGPGFVRVPPATTTPTSTTTEQTTGKMLSLPSSSTTGASSAAHRVSPLAMFASPDPRRRASAIKSGHSITPQPVPSSKRASFFADNVPRTTALPTRPLDFFSASPSLPAPEASFLTLRANEAGDSGRCYSPRRRRTVQPAESKRTSSPHLIAQAFQVQQQLAQAE